MFTVRKSKVLICNNEGKHSKHVLNLYGEQIEEVACFKYLGLMLSNNGRYNEAQKDLLQRGNKAMFKLLSNFKGVKTDFITSMHLFGYLVKPILLYNSEIWGDCAGYSRGSFYTKLKNDIVEQCHFKYCRFILGVNKLNLHNM